jgi:hypothetical protein
MADKTNPNSSSGKGYEFLPKIYQSDANKKFLQATIDQLIQPGTVNKINGYIGRQYAKATVGKDVFINAATQMRQNYQLEPGLTVQDTLGNTTFFKDYQDYINQLNVFGAPTADHQRINKQEMYSWDPHIDWDKFVNFQNYYWLPYGPEPIVIFGAQEKITSEYNITIESEGDNNVYIFEPNALVRNPTIKLYRGQTYKFNINSPGNPFSIKTRRTPYGQDLYNTPDIDNQSVEVGSITFTVPFSAPDVLFYMSESDSDLGGLFQIESIDTNTVIDVSSEILGKVNYTLADGTKLSNGMKVRFIGTVIPESYASGFYYVEGVGSSIELVPESILEIVSDYTKTENVQFDSTPFDAMPWGEATSFAGTRDYIVINRSSQDHNPWSRINRWFHKDVIEASAKYNSQVPALDQSSRAVRPIIEFEANVKLFNFGTRAIADVDLIDNFTKDVFSTIEGSLGYNVDGIQLSQNQRVLFTADTDRLVKNKIYKVTFTTIQGRRQIHLELESEPVEGNTVLVKQGVSSQGLMYWYDGSTWHYGQQKTKLNQTPYFDIFDDNGYSVSNTDVYNGSTFSGTALFSYKVGTGTVDSNLGFALSHKNINNIGDIVFNFNILNDTYQYKTISEVVTKSTNIGYLKKTNVDGTTSFINGWQKCLATTTQAAVRIYKNSNQVNNFNIDIFDDVNSLSDLVVKVYVNGIRLDNTKWSIVSGIVYKRIVLDSDISTDDVLTIKAYASQPINKNGHYEIPPILQNNPLNEEISTFTLGEVIDHVESIVENINGFSGNFPGAGNLRDLGNVTPYGVRFVQHSGPASLSIYHITNENNNVVKAIENARDEYGKFKRNFIIVAESLGIDSNAVSQVDLILEKLNKDTPNTSPFYFSDMVPYGGKIKTNLHVVDYRIKTYPLTNVFSIDELSNKAVGVYLNNVQLLVKRHYTFDPQGFIVIDSSVELANGDTITIIEYDNTNGCFVPQTPTKLGIWPKYEPKMYLDTTLLVPQNVIQGHDGSITLAYGDYRDDLIIELEKRIYNNIKVTYDTSIFDIDDIVPNYNRATDYSLEEFNIALSSSFYKWLPLVDKDFTKHLSYDRNNPMTFNYKGHAAPDGRETPGYWRGVYRWILGTDRPHLCPWEMLGFSEEPSWWTSVYGPAPYTSDNIPLWTDLSNGLVREPGTPGVVLPKYIRKYLLNHIPVDASGNVLSPLMSGLSQGIITTSTDSSFTFGDVSPVEAAWRRSSYYPFAVLLTSMLLQPAKTFGLLLDRSRIIRNVTGQLVYKDTNLRVTPKDIVLPSIYLSQAFVQTAGIINYIVDYILSDNLKSYNSYLYDLNNIEAKLSYRVGAFTSKEKFNLLLDSKTPLSQGSVFVPQEDYSIILNSSSPIKKITYSAVIVTKFADGYSVTGYSLTEPYFKYYPWTQSGVSINVGGISESYAIWTPGYQYAAGKIVEYNKKYYRSLSLHTTTATFDPTNYQVLGALPIIGGRDAILRKTWDRTDPIVIPYGTKFSSTQEIVDFLQGYGEYLKDQGFIFDNFNNTLNVVSNWETSAKEFLFWTTQNWSSGQDKWKEWTPNQHVNYGEIVRYNGEYYRSSQDNVPTTLFDSTAYVKLEGLSTVGSSVISLSPSATNITFKTPLSVVDNINNPFNNYEIFKVDGTPLASNFLNSYREENAVSYTPRDDYGIFGASFYLIQQEQVVLINNTTIFNDTIYNPASGYRQERIKVAGYVSTDWYGGFDVPGFIFDQAVIQNWEPWQDYALGDIVKYKEFYYSAGSFVPGAETFDATKWIKDTDKPTQTLLPNWTYRAGQFMDFYSLDSDNFDSSQQQLAQHLVGYQKRQYLSNIIKDDVSEFKFYQGMIAEKGTQNVLNKLFDVLSAADQSSLSFYEEWALRLSQYGSTAAFENIEFNLDESLFKANPQGIELVQTVDNALVDFIIRQTPNDVYLKPLGYNNAPWPVIDKFKPYLRTPGYVRSDDVTATLASLEDILTQDVSLFSEGSYIWCAFDNPPHFWNVYRLTNDNLTVTDAAYAGTTLTITCSNTITYNVGDYIAIKGVQKFSNFYKIINVDTNSFDVTATISGWEPFAEQSTIQIFSINTQRVGRIDDAQTILPLTLTENEIIWTDDNGSGKWTVWQHNNIYSKSELSNSIPQDGLLYGRQVLVNKSNSISILSNSLGEIIVYDKATSLSPWIQRQIIVPPFISATDINGNPTSDTETGDVIALSSNSVWFASGVPTASQAVTISNTNLNIVDSTGTTSGFDNQGVVTIYKKDNNNIFTPEYTIASPNPDNDEMFGSSLVFGDNRLFVTASGSNQIYQLEYVTATQATASYNPVGSSEYTVKISVLSGTITEGMTVVGDGFTSGQTVVQVVDSNTIIISSLPDSTPSGVLQFTLTYWQYTNNVLTPAVPDTAFGEKLVMSDDNSTLFVTSPTVNRTYYYSNNSGTYDYVGYITGSSDICVSSDATYVAVSDISYNSGRGKVTVYVNTGSGYEEYQPILNDQGEANDYFGSKIRFMNNFQTLVIFSETSNNVGRISTYDRYSLKWVYGDTITNPSNDADGFGSSFSVGNNIIFVSAPSADDQGVMSGKVYTFVKSANALSWKVLHEQIDKPDVTKIKQAFLYNKQTNQLVTYLDVIDPTQGKIPGIAEEELKYKTFYDPAVYSVGTDAVNVDDGIAWSAAQVGTLWWDLRTAKFIDSSDNDVVYRNSTWNTLFPGASIDVYEWVSSTMLPSAWNTLADTEEGLAVGISGTTLYDDTVYSITKRYDNVSKTFKRTYYYWVKNKVTLPNLKNRNITAKDVAALIENPRGQGYRYIALTSANSFSLVNVKPLLNDVNIVLSIEYWTVDSDTRNIHTEWKLVSNDVESALPASIEQKWFDSLCGKDSSGRIVPDTTLPIKLRYGIENRPRQGIFVNRFEALKQLIEQVNRVLIKNQISENRDLSLLGVYDSEPNVIKGLYDATLDTDAELKFAVISTFVKPSLSPVITDGKITGVDIINKGNGYLVAPYIDVIGNGINAKIRTVINVKGQITGVKIENAGEGYDQSTVLVIRNYAVLVKSDSQADGSWSIYSYEPLTQVWSRLQSQTYDTRKYWNYVDWYDTGFNQFVASDYVVDTLSSINSIDVQVGQLVKVTTNNAGNWMLLRKYQESTSVDWTQSYQVVGIQNGTIQFSSSLYDFEGSVYGYDGSLYDGSIFDNAASVELRNILTSIKNSILIDDLKVEYLNLFFSNLRYALAEQSYIDWAFKTSFVKVHHNVGKLSQKVTYSNDNLTDFESYVNEVKPYRTKVREYISNYSNIDTGKMSITDFDVPPIFEGDKVITIGTGVSNGKITATDSAIHSYPWKHWLDNVGFKIVDIKIIDQGSGYISAPVVRFVGSSGKGATARAFISNGKVNRITLLTQGSDYLDAPRIVLDGGMLPSGTPATAVAIIGDSVVRSTLIKMKFDRITKTYVLNSLEQTETKYGTGSRLQFPLVWAPDIRVNQSSVTIDGVDALRDSYKLTTVKSTSKGYTSYSGSITFDVAPAVGAEIKITYKKDWSLLNAADRVQFYYDPATGELGKDLAQLMSGIDYGGVIVSGMGFEVNGGWDNLPYYSDKWASLDETYNDIVKTIQADGEHTIELGYVPETGTELNVYYAKLNNETYIDTDGVTVTYPVSVYDNAPLNVEATITRTVTHQSNLGIDSLILNSVVGLKVGDVLTIPSVVNGVAYNCKISQILPLSNTIKLGQILFRTIPVNATAVFTRTLVSPTDYTINATGLVQLTEPLVQHADLSIKAYLNKIRIDDPNYDGAFMPDKPYAIMKTVIADGAISSITIPSGFDTYAGDEFLIRKSTSDGSIAPGEDDYDTALSGGTLDNVTGVYSTATGKTADEIIIDGDGFVTPTTNPSPEEVVPGQVVDAVAIKVFDRPSIGNAVVKVDSFLGDGTTDSFVISQTPNSKQAIIVKTVEKVVGIDGTLSRQSYVLERDTDYTFDYKNKTVTTVVPPADGVTISIFSIGFNGSNILDLDYFVGNGVTKEFITKAPWLKDVSYMVYVDGQPAIVELFKTDSSYESTNRIGIRFITEPADQSLISFVIVSGTQQTFSVTKSETFAGNGTDTYQLANIIGDSLPIESNMIVRVNQNILLAPNNNYFTIKSNKLNYTIDPIKFLPYTVSANDIVVLVDGNLLNPAIDYIIDLSGITIKINKATYKKYTGKQLIVSIKQGEGYHYVPSTPPLLVTSQAYQSTDTIEVISSYQHDILDMQRTAINITSNLSLTPSTEEYYKYRGLSSGLLKLDRAVLNDSYIWVIKNGTLLTPGIDFKLRKDKQSIKLAFDPAIEDQFSIITFGTNVLSSGIAYMQFKDILNRTIFKRLNKTKQTVLTQALHQTDTTIHVADASNFDPPSPANNKPGIIEISGERIEYFTLNGNVLGQIRRGTLGTGVRDVHKVGAIVQEIGVSETLPYTEDTVIAKVDSNGTTNVDLEFVPSSVDEIEVFVGGRRLKKYAYSEYRVDTNYPDSPEGDVAFAAEFSVDGVSKKITLRDAPIVGNRIVVVKRLGKSWDSAVNIQHDTNKIAQFLKSEPGTWYSEFKNT